MAEESPDTRRDQVLDDFRRSLSVPLSERFYDEDELIEVFDYAGDVNDDYLRMEALLCGARFYPDSDELLQRRAIFYSQYADDVRDRFLDDTGEASGMMWDMLRIRKAAPTGDEARKSLDFLLDNYDDYTDEEAIQLVALASALGAFQWIKDNFQTLRSRISYVNILVYEAAVTADSEGDSDFAIEMLEELTRLEPFNPLYWQMLARQYFLADKIDQAISAIDYSLAIDASDLQSRLIKANLLYNGGAPAESIIKETEAIVSADQHSYDATKFLAHLYNEGGRSADALRLLRDFIDANPDQALSVIPELLIYNPADMDTMLDRFYSLNDDNSSYVWGSWAQQLMSNGMHDQARKVVECYERNSGDRLNLLFTIERMFKEGRFRETLESLDSYITDLGGKETNVPAVALMHILALAKSGQTDKALAVCLMIESMYDPKTCTSISAKLEYAGLMQTIKLIKDRLAGNPGTDLVDLDPLSIWDTQA